MSKAVVVVVLVVGLVGVLNMAAAAQQAQEREPILYAVASFFIPGLGQVLQDEVQTGIVHFGIAVAIPIAGSYLRAVSPAPIVIGWSVAAAQFAWSLYSAFHSHDLAVEHNRRHGFALVDLDTERSMTFTGP